MKSKYLAAALGVAMASSTAALSAGSNPLAVSGYNPGQLFNCVVRLPGPPRVGPCWLDHSSIG